MEKQWYKTAVPKHRCTTCPLHWKSNNKAASEQKTDQQPTPRHERKWMCNECTQYVSICGEYGGGENRTVPETLRCGGMMLIMGSNLESETQGWHHLQNASMWMAERSQIISEIRKSLICVEIDFLFMRERKRFWLSAIRASKTMSDFPERLS